VIGTYRPVEVLGNGHPLNGVLQELYAYTLCVEVELGLLHTDDIAAYLRIRFPESVSDWLGAGIGATDRRESALLGQRCRRLGGGRDLGAGERVLAVARKPRSDRGKSAKEHPPAHCSAECSLASGRTTSASGL
jgi:hypothetical protein